MLNIEEMVSELEKKTKIPREELLEKIKKKKEELSGLVSEEGACHIVARDLGVDLLKIKKKPMKIKDLAEGMKRIDLKARIVQVTESRSFQRDDKTTGKVCNLILSDGTGEIRLPLWDKQAEMIEQGFLSEGDVVEVKNAVVKKNVFGGLELRVPRLSIIEKIEDDTTIPEEPVRKLFARIKLKESKEGFYEVKGSLVNVFNTNPLFYTCPECGKKVEQTEEGYKCDIHGIVEPKSNMIISGIFDDGTDTIRAVFFRDQARAISSLEPSVLSSMEQDEAVNLIRENVLGNEFVLRGIIRKSKIFDDLEFVVNDVKELDIEEESRKILDKLEH